MTVREIKRTSLLNAPEKLRELAKEIEARGEPYTAIVVVGYPDGRVSVRGYGPRSDSLACSGWLARAQTLMTEDAGQQDNFTPESTG